ncbi:hypothetical protein V4890_19825 [Ralstonia solanacearum species complex bacterium KE056]|uniref:hypothetical protein n=1 Tax=Ralstonia solanacearum species complex bacterium KE056 TaxID=3119585 RepID=UPI002FC2FD28
MEVPLFAYLVCPAIFVVRLISLILERGGVKRVVAGVLLGFPIILLTGSISSIVLSSVHDQWMMGKIRTWGAEIRNERSVGGKFPKSKVASLHGYVVVFIKGENDSNPPFIIFNKFGGMRQVYSVLDDRFLEETEI